MSTLAHTTVLLNEAVAGLAIAPDGVYVDGTFGRGGHSRRILQALGDEGRLWVFDKDPEAIAAAHALAQKDSRVGVIHAGFGDFQAASEAHHLGAIDGALLDLGVSSPQIDTPERGFSFRFDAPLDMRMDTTQGVTAAQWLDAASESDIIRVLLNWGEERFARAIAREIAQARAIAPITRTSELAALCQRVVRTHDKQHPATRTFQALRIEVNGELSELETALPALARALKPGGRLAVIAFHSLEDRCVKHWMKASSSVAKPPRWAAIKESELPEPPMARVGKAIRPTAEEVKNNPRARSAVLRVAQRTQAPWPSQDGR